ncbi:sensor histidine kinase [Sorangium sp. So ce315]|uniref:sensor histidine kinase n=1 Tax=Sorangium sp. So ce315 TaxID=3133299 RepID=UPI003F630F6E
MDPSTSVETVLATQSGKIVYPPTPPSFAAEPSWKALFTAPDGGPSTTTIDLLGRRTVVARSPVAGAELIYLLIADEEGLFLGARARLRARLALGLTLAAAPLALLVLLLQRSLARFRRAEEQARRQERLRLVGEAANQIAHEVKNSLNGIKMAVEMACDPRGSSARSERALAELRSEIARLTSFTSELMTFSKGVVPHCTRVDLEEFVPRVVSLQQEAAARAGSALDVTLTGAPLVVQADPSLLHIVLSNLVTNAIDAVVVASSGEPRIRVGVRAEDRWARVEVSDNGPGVAEPVRARLFEPFQSGKPSGVGIGLALSKRIAVAHGGDLVLAPAGRGATFTLSLPRPTP